MKVSAALALLLACLFTATITFAAPEKVYKWTDSKGNVHYAQRPPANTDTEVIKPQTGHSDPVTYTAPAGDANKEVKKTADDAKALKDPERCANARKNIETLKTYARIKIKGDDGEFRYLTPDEQQQKLTEANKAASESCDE